jgi:hypothetical protein
MGPAISVVISHLSFRACHLHLLVIFSLIGACFDWMSDDIFEFIADKEAFYTGLHLYVSTSQEVIETSQMNMKSETCWPIFSLALNNLFEKMELELRRHLRAVARTSNWMTMRVLATMREKMKSFGGWRLEF